jgi:hypothetical protein
VPRDRLAVIGTTNLAHKCKVLNQKDMTGHSRPVARFDILPP